MRMLIMVFQQVVRACSSPLSLPSLVNYVIGHEEGEGRIINLIMFSFIFNKSAQSASMCVCIYHAVPIFTADLIGCRTAALSNVLLS